MSSKKVPEARALQEAQLWVGGVGISAHFGPEVPETELSSSAQPRNLDNN